MKSLLILIIFIPLKSYAALNNETEASVVQTSGNTNVSTYLLKTLTKYAANKYSYNFGGHYTYGETDNQLKARDWDVNLKYERIIKEEISYYIADLTEGYKFQGIKARYNNDAGIKYYFTKSDVVNFFSELGYRYSMEDRYSGATQYENKGRVYAEYNKKPSQNFQYKLWTEYLPNFTNKNYIFNYEASITAVITSVLGLKVAYKNIYYSEPIIKGNKNNDGLLSSSLVAKF